MEKECEKDISKRHNVSSSTTNRILDNIYKDYLIKNNGHLPSILGTYEFKATYNYYKGILKSIDKKDKDTSLSIINNKDNQISNYANKANKTFLDMKNHILNHLDYTYSNGIVEGINNLIKQIKHAPCGYRKFKHLKIRIMLVKELLNPIRVHKKSINYLTLLSRFI